MGADANPNARIRNSEWEHALMRCFIWYGTMRAYAFIAPCRVLDMMRGTEPADTHGICIATDRMCYEPMSHWGRA